MDEVQLIKLMNENGFTKKEIDKLLLAAEKYPATLEWVVCEFAHHFKGFAFALLITSAVFCIPTFSAESDIVVKLFILTVYAFVMFVSYKVYAINYIIKCFRFMRVLKGKHEEADSDE
jgi:hypothetical protein